MVSINNSDNNTVGASNSGVTNTFTVTNSSNTASSAANCQITVGGGTAADPQTTYTVTGATDWSVGIDNSASDAYVIAASTALGTTNVVSIATGGAVSFVLGNVDVTKSSSGADVSETVSNTSNTASSTATHYAIVAGTSAGDAQYQASVSGTTQWTWGIDNSVTSPTADPWVLAQGTALGTNNVMSVATSGEINYPLQPSFFGINTSTRTDVTGDNTTYNIIGDSEIYDQNSDYNNSTGTFTAPVTGRYLFAGNVTLSQLTTGVFDVRFRIVASNRRVDFLLYPIFTSGTTGVATFSGACFVDMDSSDICNLAVIASGGTKIVDVLGDATQALTSFSGQLMA